MPIQSTQFSPSVSAVNKAQETFAINATDGKVKFAGKVAGRTLTNTALTVAATLETVVLAVLTAATLGLVKTFREGTKLAGRATAEAFKGIAGYQTAKKVPTKVEQVRAFVNKYAAKAVVAGKAGFEAAKVQATAVLKTAKNHKGKTAAAVIGTGVIGGSYLLSSLFSKKLPPLPLPNDPFYTCSSAPTFLSPLASKEICEGFSLSSPKFVSEFLKQCVRA